MLPVWGCWMRACVNRLWKLRIWVCVAATCPEKAVVCGRVNSERQTGSGNVSRALDELYETLRWHFWLENWAHLSLICNSQVQKALRVNLCVFGEIVAKIHGVVKHNLSWFEARGPFIHTFDCRNTKVIGYWATLLLFWNWQVFNIESNSAPWVSGKGL